MARRRFRIRFSKLGRLKFIGHIDLLRTLELLFRRAKLPIAMSCGFHPKMRMSFPSALGLGFGSLDEVLDLEMQEQAGVMDADNLLHLLNQHTIEGLTFLSARLLGENEKKAKLLASIFQTNIPAAYQKHTADKIETFMKESSIPVTKSAGRMVDVRQAVLQMSFDSSTGCLTIELQTQAGPEAGIKEVLAALGLEKELFVSIFPQRVRCRLAEETGH